jgi:hypothetical protein
MSKPRILIQLDGDAQASVFDGIVAIDSGVEHLFRHGSVTRDQVRDLVHGAIFTRGPHELSRTAIFIGGSDVAAGETLLARVVECFFGPMRVSVMLDPNGANTTAAAAVLCAARHLALAGATVLVLAATGPVGQRVAELLAREGAAVRAASRSLERARGVCSSIAARIAPKAKASLTAYQTSSGAETAAALDGVDAVIAAGAAGVRLIEADLLRPLSQLAVAIDLNAVPPLGIDIAQVTDKAVNREGVVCYGAIGVGGTKMKIHKAALEKLFSANDLVLDAPQIYDIGRQLEQSATA